MNQQTDGEKHRTKSQMHFCSMEPQGLAKKYMECFQLPYLHAL